MINQTNSHSYVSTYRVSEVEAAYHAEANQYWVDRVALKALLGMSNIVCIQLRSICSVLESVIPSLPKAASEVFTSATTFNMQALFPANGSYDTYGGSLTTPPCSETVRWFVMESPIEASAAQINSFKTIEHANARPVQQIGTRTIQYFKQ